MTSTNKAIEDSAVDKEVADKNSSAFASYLQRSSRIVALLGAGLSASSGIPTFRGVDSLWRGLSPRDLATPYCFRDDPVLFWHFHNHRRYLTLRAQPNRGHYALGKLAQVKSEFMAISQNIDGQTCPRVCSSWTYLTNDDRSFGTRRSRRALLDANPWLVARSRM